MAGYLVTLFALGYRFDFVNNKFVKTGSFSLKANISINVYINDSFVGKSSFLTNNFSKKRLAPKIYRVRAEHEGYRPWHKEVKVDAGILTDFPALVLISKEFKESEVARLDLARNSRVLFSPETDSLIIFSGSGSKITGQEVSLIDGTKKLLRKISQDKLDSENQKNIQKISPDNQKSILFTDHEVFIRWLEDSSHQPFKKAGDEELITRFSEKIQDIQWYKNSEHLIALVGSSLKFIEIDTRSGVNIFDLAVSNGPFYYSRKSDLIYLLSGNKLISLDFLK